MEMQEMHSSKIKSSAEAEKKVISCCRNSNQQHVEQIQKFPKQKKKKKKRAISWNLTINESFGF